MKTKLMTKTDGKGYWSNVSRDKIVIHEVDVSYVDEVDPIPQFGELRASFSPVTWDVNKDGLIYTDETWMKTFREGLVSLGFSESVVADVDYSEQGMQGEDYVSMDIGGKFLSEWYKRTMN